VASTQNQGAGGGQYRQGQAGKTTSGADEGAVGGVVSAVKDAASSAVSSAEDAWDSTRENVQQAASAVADTAADAWGDLTGVMRRYPFGTLFVGIGIGFVLSRLVADRGARDIGRFGSELYDRARGYASDVASRLQS
jgi:ElaB/YqjD/DUF883 family membrane-anchored ribosome-binding protein